jgi:hypothetical protein
MLHSLFLSHTPGRADVFPDDASPISIVPRIFNAYLGTDLTLASEESFVGDLRGIPTNGYFVLEPWNP